MLSKFDISFGHISKKYLKLKKIKTCHPEEINKYYDAKKIILKKDY